MATVRTQQAHQKRVQKIVDEAADQIAADSPVEEAVIVTVEEVPTDDPAVAPPARAGDLTDTLVVSAAKGQQLAANWISAWTDMTKQSWNTPQLFELADPRSMVERSFQFAQELLAVQKDFALRLVDAMPVGK